MTPLCFSRLRLGLLALLAIAVLAWPSQTGHAELIRLTDGSVLQAEIVGFDEDTVTLRRLDTGGEFRLRWTQLAEEDRERLRRQLGLELPEIEGVITEIGDRIELFDGTVHEGRLVEEETNQQRVVLEFLEYGNWTRVTVARDEIADEFYDVPINARQLLTSEQLYDRLIAMHPPEEPEIHFLLAQYCRELGLFEEGLAHLEAIEELPEFSEVVGPLMELFEELIDQAEIREMLDEARIFLRRGSFNRSRERIEEVLEIRTLSEVIRESAEELREEWRLAAGTAIGQRYMRLIESYAGNKGRRDISPAQLRRYAVSSRRGVRGEELPERGSSEWEELTLREQILVTLHDEFDLPVGEIAELFAARDRDQIRALSVRLSTELLELFGAVRTRNNPRRDRQGLAEQEEAYKSRLYQRQRNRGREAGADRNGEELSPEEIWERTRSGTRSQLIVFLFCESHPEIERVDERERGASMWYQYR